METSRFDTSIAPNEAPARPASPNERLIGAATRMGVTALKAAKAAGYSDTSMTRAFHSSAAALTILAGRYMTPRAAVPDQAATKVIRLTSPLGLAAALETPGLECLEVPVSILDRRWQTPEIATALRNRGNVTIHAYDVFLTGLLTTKTIPEWPFIDGVKPAFVIETLDVLTRELRRQSRADLCLAYVRGLDWVDGVLVDPASDSEWDTITRLSTKAPLTPSECATVEDILPRLPELLLNPSLWP